MEMIANGRKGFEFKKREGLRTLVMKVAVSLKVLSNLWAGSKFGSRGASPKVGWVSNRAYSCRLTFRVP